MSYRTNRALHIERADLHWNFDVPAGVEVVKVGGTGGGYAIMRPEKYGLNAHDARHRYVWVPADAVETYDPKCIHNVRKADCALCKPGAHGE